MGDGFRRPGRRQAARGEAKVWGEMSLFKLGSGLGLVSSDSYESCLGGDSPIGWGR